MACALGIIVIRIQANKSKCMEGGSKNVGWTERILEHCDVRQNVKTSKYMDQQIQTYISRASQVFPILSTQSLWRFEGNTLGGEGRAEG